MINTGKSDKDSHGIQLKNLQRAVKTRNNTLGNINLKLLLEKELEMTQTCAINPGPDEKNTQLVNN